MIDWHHPLTLRIAIKNAGLTIEKFSHLSGVSRTQMLRLLAGTNKPTWGTQSKIEGALKVLSRQSKRAPKMKRQQAAQKDSEQTPNGVAA